MLPATTLGMIYVAYYSRLARTSMIEALGLEFPDTFDCKMVDVFRDYLPAPLRYAPEIYPPMTKFPETWAISYKTTDGKRRSRAVIRMLFPYVARSIRRLYRENPSDVIVSVHPLVNTAMLRTMKKHPTPFMTVVTDMVTNPRNPTRRDIEVIYEEAL